MFWVIPRHLNFICRCFGTHCLFHLHRQVGASTHTYLPMKMEESVPKCRHIKFRCQGITQKKAYNIQNTAKVWNQEINMFTKWNLCSLWSNVVLGTTLYNFIRYQCFRRTCSLHPLSHRWGQNFPPKCWWSSVKIHGFLTQKTSLNLHHVKLSIPYHLYFNF